MTFKRVVDENNKIIVLLLIDYLHLFYIVEIKNCISATCDLLPF